ncbi:MAG: hypothetical protein WKG03_05965 [Telluria sp.]
MKLATALRYASEVARRVQAVNGLLATPLCNYEAVRIRRIWVFGSTVKGSQAPNDLDLLIDLAVAGRRYSHAQTRACKRQLRSYGVRSAPDARDDALKWLTKGMRMVSRHCLDNECAVIDTKVLIYPRNDLAELQSAFPKIGERTNGSTDII